MLSFIFFSVAQQKRQLAEQAKVRRLALNLSRETLSERSGVSAASIKRFETKGEISLDALLKIARVLDASLEFEQLFQTKTPLSLEQLPIKRKRGRT